jgi:LysM repeat protein
MDFSSPGRLLAPAALILALVAVAAIIATSTGGEDGSTPAARTTQEGEGGTGTGTPTSTTPARTQTAPRTSTSASGPETYTVQSGDTFGSIAEETGVSVEELQELNPELDPQTLSVGDTVRLRR